MRVISNLKHISYDFSDSRKYLVCCSANKIFLYKRGALEETIAKIKCKHVSNSAISKQEDLIYILDTSGNFYLYDIADESLKKIPNTSKAECFSEIKVFDDGCIWCAGEKLFRFSRETNNIEVIFSEKDVLLCRIIKADSDSVYMAATIKNNCYIIHFYFDSRVYYKKIRTYKSFSISKILYHQPSDTFVVVKGKKMFVPKGNINFDDNNDIKLTKTDYKLKKGDVEDVKFSNDGELIGIKTRKFIFSNTIQIYNIKSRELIFETYADAEKEYGLGEFEFSTIDSDLYISLDNWNK